MKRRKAKFFKIVYAIQCLRDMADQDYIAARMAYRLDLLDQFLWSALQAIEKYLKAMLIFNNESTLDLKHDISKAYERVLLINNNQFIFPPKLKEFIDYLELYGNNRYLDIPSQTEGYELHKLDWAVWYIRRYCQILNYKDRPTTYYSYLNSPELEAKPVSFRLEGGFLERILDRNDSGELRRALIWKNPCYGARKKGLMKNYKIKMRLNWPIHFKDPQAYEILKHVVFFPKDLKSELEEQARLRKLGMKSE